MPGRGPDGEPLYRVNRRFRCPVCGKATWCSFTRHHAVCMRTPSTRPTRNGGWIHALSPDLRRAAQAEIRRRRLDPTPPPPAGRDTTDLLLRASEPLLRHHNRWSFATRRDHAAIWRDFMRFLGSRGLVDHPRQIVPAHIRAYLDARRARGDSEAVLNRRLAVISQLHGQLDPRLRRFAGELKPAVRDTPSKPGRSRALELYVTAHSRRERDLSISTRRRYGKAWRRFARWLATQEPTTGDPVSALKHLAASPAEAAAVLHRYLTWLSDQGTGPAARAVERSAVRALFARLRARKEDAS